MFKSMFAVTPTIQKNEYSLFFEQQIKVHKNNILISTSWAIFLLLIGVVATILCFKLDKSIATKIPDLMKMGPLFVSTAVISFPFKEFLCSRSRIATYKFLRDYCAANDNRKLNKAMLEVIADVFRQTIK